VTSTLQPWISLGGSTSSFKPSYTFTFSSFYLLLPPSTANTSFPAIIFTTQLIHIFQQFFDTFTTSLVLQWQAQFAAAALIPYSNLTSRDINVGWRDANAGARSTNVDSRNANGVMVMSAIDLTGPSTRPWLHLLEWVQRRLVAMAQDHQKNKVQLFRTVPAAKAVEK